MFVLFYVWMLCGGCCLVWVIWDWMGCVVGVILICLICFSVYCLVFVIGLVMGWLVVLVSCLCCFYLFRGCCCFGVCWFVVYDCGGWV